MLRLRQLIEAWGEAMEEALQEDIFQYDPEFTERIVNLMEVYGRYFDSEVRGSDRFPESVPVVGHGGHSTSIVLTRGEGIAKALGLNKLRFDVMPIAFTLPWGVVLGPIPALLPLPAKVIGRKDRRLSDQLPEPGHVHANVKDTDRTFYGQSKLANLSRSGQAQ